MVLDLFQGTTAGEITIQTIKKWKPKKPQNEIKNIEGYYRDSLKKSLDAKFSKHNVKIYKEKAYTDAGNADISIEQKKGKPEIIIELKKYSNFQQSEFRRIQSQVNSYCNIPGVECIFIVFVGEKPENKKLFLPDLEVLIENKNEEYASSSLASYFFTEENRIIIFEKYL